MKDELSAERVFLLSFELFCCPYVMCVFVPDDKNSKDTSLGHKHPQREKRRVHVYVSPRVHIRQRRKVA